MKTALILILALTACGQKKSSSDQASTDPLIGVWKSNCVDNLVTQRTFTEDGRLTTYYSNYSDTNCYNIEYTVRTEASYTIKEGNKFDVTAHKTFFKIKDQDTVDLWSKDKMFGIATWILDTYFEITDLLSTPSEPKPMFPKDEKFYQIFRISNSVLQFGDSDIDNAESEDARPKSYNTVTNYTKQ